jgi:hypothetical protein
MVIIKILHGFFLLLFEKTESGLVLTKKLKTHADHSNYDI